ncbi:helicase-associated domain-containing protein [Paramicrobacterium sp. CJ85]|uniref:helicase-associated domain-containing protein n=1 Tax=Paramicrobacterium sp. CJ85 TaxID=3445355 RepID=UPI003F6041CE
MTDALIVATHLRSLSDDELERLLTARGIDDDARLGDFFDVAERLLERQRLSKALEQCDRRMLLSLSAAAEIGASHSEEELVAHVLAFGNGEDVAQEAADGAARAERLALIVRDERIRPLSAVADALDELHGSGLPSARQLADHPPTTLCAVEDASGTEAISGERAFLTTTMVGELITQTLRAPARELGRGGLALPDARRLASVSGAELDEIEPLLAIAAAAGLLTLHERQWSPTPHGVTWMDQPTVVRWRTLAEAWLESIPTGLRPLISVSPSAQWSASLRQRVAWTFPLGGGGVTDSVGSIVRHADLLGITARDRLSTSGRELLAGVPEAAEASIRDVLPHEVSQVYVQDDLSVISPGPLTPARDTRLRGMAEVESRSQASTYRFTRSSIDRALSTGEDAASIRAFLDDVSLTGIPQPLSYLIDDVAAQHGLVRVSASASAPGAHSSIISTDHDLLDTLAVDQTLATLGLRRTEPGRLESRFARDVVFWALHDARYPASAVDDDGALVPVLRSHVVSPAAPPRADLRPLIARLRQSSTANADEPDAAWLARQLELAVRNRRAVRVTVAMPGGRSVDLVLEPTGLAGGRLRGRDHSADVERTLPLSSITAVSPVES